MVAWLSGMEHRFRDYPFARPWFNSHPSHVVINLYYTLDGNTSTATVTISLSLDLNLNRDKIFKKFEQVVPKLK